jgi:hypothetical protein
VAPSGPDVGMPPRQAAPDRSRKTAFGVVLLGMAGQALRSRQFYEAVAVAVIAAAAVKGMGQESRTNTTGRLIAWQAREVQRLQNKAGKQAHRIERKANRQVRKIKAAVEDVAGA